MRERLQELIQAKAISPKKLAEIINVQPSAISHILSGRNKPSFELLGRLLTAFPDINPTWLILGKGNIYTKPIVQGQTTNSKVLEKRSKDLFEDFLLEPLPLSKNDEPNLASENSQINSQSDLTSQLPNSSNQEEIDRVILFFKNGTFISYSSK